MSISLKWCNKEWLTCAGGRQMGNIKDGVTYIDNYNEELDSATVVLQNVEKQDFEPFDQMILTLQPIGPVHYMLINDFVENEVEVGSGLYQYTINLVSKTKALERVTLPNISITKPKSEPNHTTIYQQVGRLLEDYSPRIIYNSSYTQLYRRGNTVSRKECPDMQMSRPTLRDALNRIMSVDNSICYVDKDNQIQQMNLNQRFNEIKLTEPIGDGIQRIIPYFSYKPENQSANDYASETENNYNNVVPNELENIDEDTNITEYIGFRSEQMIVDDNNAVIITQHPIYDLKKVYWCGRLSYGISTYDNTFNVQYNGVWYYNLPLAIGDYYMEIDITDHILEEQDYNILPYDPDLINTNSQAFYAYYNRGNNKIEGLLNYKKTFFESWITLALILNKEGRTIDNFITLNGVLDTIKNALPAEEQATFDTSKINYIVYGGDYNYDNFPRLTDDSRKKSMFKVVYEAQNEDVRAKTGKYLRERNQDNVIIDNPGEAFVDIKRQGELFYSKCNRLGNRVKEIHARFPIEYFDQAGVYAPALGDYIGDFVLIRREFSFHDNYIDFKGILTENYVNINYFTGINARKRTWEIVSANEAFDKELLDKWYVEFGYSRIGMANNESNWSMMRSDFIHRMLPNSSGIGLTQDLIGHVHFSNSYTDNGESSHVELDLTRYISGNSLILNCKTDDNYSVGIRVKSTDPRTVEDYIKYVDNDGEATNFYIDLYKKNMPSGAQYLSNIYNYKGQIITQELIDQWTELSRYKPRIYIPNVNQLNSDYGMYGYNFLNHKDSREKLGFNIQFEFCSREKDIIIGEDFINYIRFISSRRMSIKAYLSKTITYKITERSLKTDSSSVQVDAYATPVTGNSASDCQYQFTIEGVTNLSQYKSISIYSTETGRLIMAINITENLPTLVYSGNTYINLHVNMLRTRDRNNYSSYDLTNWGT